MSCASRNPVVFARSDVCAPSSTQFEFADGVEGVLLKYTMPVHGKFSVYQLQAGRLDDRTFTTLTISTEASRLNEGDLKNYLTCIAKATVTVDAEASP